MRTYNTSGQVMIIAILILTMLLIVVPNLIWVNNHLMTHALMAQKGQEAVQGSQQAVSFAVNSLSDPATWSNALQANFSNPCGQPYTDPKGGQYLISCSTGTAAQRYEVQVNAFSVASSTQPKRGQKAVLSRKTLAVTVSSDLSASAALVLYSVPVLNGALNVHWGPIVQHTNGTPGLWTLTGPMEQFQYPRKFSDGGLTGPTFARAAAYSPPNTDQQEYWAWASLGLDPPINVGSYQTDAVNASGLPITNVSPNTAELGTSGSFTTPVTFGAAGAGNAYTLNKSTAIVITGNTGSVTFTNIAIDLKSQPYSPASGLVVAGTLNAPTGTWTGGNLVLDSGGLPGGGQALTDIRVPPTAPLEYPNASYTWPCSTSVGGVCSSAQLPATLPKTNIDFRGFLYVTGDLTVATGDWVIVGAVRVDGLLTVKSGASLTILYDDEINHDIRTALFQLQVQNCAETMGQQCASWKAYTRCDGSCY